VKITTYAFLSDRTHETKYGKAQLDQSEMLNTGYLVHRHIYSTAYDSKVGHGELRALEQGSTEVGHAIVSVFQKEGLNPSLRIDLIDPTVVFIPQQRYATRENGRNGRGDGRGYGVENIIDTRMAVRCRKRVDRLARAQDEANGKRKMDYERKHLNPKGKVGYSFLFSVPW